LLEVIKLLDIGDLVLAETEQLECGEAREALE
jgi:hypothetical protein